MGLLPNFRAWRITNTDTGQTVEGNFEATDVNRTVTANYVRHNSLNRHKPITQFLSGDADKLSFTARLFQHDAFDRVTEKFETLVAWAQRDPDLKRPPIVLFSIGNADTAYFDNSLAVIERISNITFDSPTVLGQVRGITFAIELVEYNEYLLEGGAPPETRYAHAKAGDYMELLAQEEYGEPLLGDVIRKRMPQLQIVAANDIVKLPSIAAIQSTPIVQTSVALKTAFGRKESPQKTLREAVLTRLSGSYRSVIVPAGL